MLLTVLPIHHKAPFVNTAFQELLSVLTVKYVSSQNKLRFFHQSLFPNKKTKCVKTTVEPFKFLHQNLFPNEKKNKRLVSKSHTCRLVPFSKMVTFMQIHIYFKKYFSCLIYLETIYDQSMIGKVSSASRNKLQPCKTFSYRNLK